MKQVGIKDEYLIEIENNIFNVRTNTHESESRFYWDVDRHCNAEYEVHIIIHGECEVTLDSNTFIIKQGSLLVINPGCYHSSKTLTDKLEHFCFGFYDNDNFFKKNIKKDKYYLVNNINSNIENYCFLYHNECERRDILYSDNKKLLMSLVFIELLRLLNLRYTNTDLIVNNVNPIDIIDQFFEQNHSINNGEEVLAKMLYVSKRQLSRYLKQYYGLSYREKLLYARIEHAKRLLSNSYISIENISKMIGYSSETAFYNMFKKQCKSSPQQYRIECRKGKNKYE